MTVKTKRIIFWAVIAIIAAGIFLYLLFTKPGNAVMAMITGVSGLVLGWFARVLYSKYIKQ